jgi:hypothetical protein
MDDSCVCVFLCAAALSCRICIDDGLAFGFGSLHACKADRRA